MRDPWIVALMRALRLTPKEDRVGLCEKLVADGMSRDVLQCALIMCESEEHFHSPKVHQWGDAADTQEVLRRLERIEKLLGEVVGEKEQDRHEHVSDETAD